MKIGEKIHRVQTCPSTNDLAKELAERGAEQGEVVVCEEQTKGKGTKGRTWHSLPGKGLYFSVLLFPSRSDISLLPLAASLAVREGILEELNIMISLRWPNDLICDGLKIGGILCESSFSGKRLNYSIIGIGINVKHKKNDFPSEIKRTAGSLEMICKKSIDKDRLLLSVCFYMEKWYRLFLNIEDQILMNKYLEASYYHIGNELKAEAKGTPVSGLFKGLDREGKVILEINGREERFLSGEIRIINS
ncbi:MAG: biotin--[acetyl-CoA-carboxylase] ligase [Candidatus Aminicenantes bacterium]|nr:biotin--[acetyl-CoA-carboxylase] ligase [Candidatus Aminicenantes bacterium]